MWHKSYRALVLKSIRKYSTRVKPKVEVNETVVNKIENGEFKPRKHPGVFKPRTINVPNEFILAVEKAMSDYPVKQILADSKILTSYLRSRHPPIEETDYLCKKSEVEKDVLSQHADLETVSDEERRNLREKLKGKITKLLKTKLYAWKPMDYNVHTSLQYLLARSAAEYAVLVRIFQEISLRDSEFKPRSYFDFGSGVGTGTWAAKVFWQKNLFEYFNVDCSVHMNDLALILLKGGTGVSEPNLKGVYHRQFLPATNTTYDLVLSAYSLFELPSTQARLETVLKLWNKTQEYLIIVEQGTNAGFKLVNEARDFILDIKDDTSRGHVFSPCPHDEVCPRFLTDHTPCNFQISYMNLPIGQNAEIHRERYCYVVLRKGQRRNETDLWPRIVRPTLIRSKHAICRMCTSKGQLEEVIFTASKHGNVTYQCAKGTRWGDLLPMTIKHPSDEEN